MVANDNEVMETLQLMLQHMDKNFTEIKDRLTRVENRVAKIEVEHGQKLEALVDWYKEHTERLDRIENKLDALSNKVDEHDIKIQVIEGGKSKKAN